MESVYQTADDELGLRQKYSRTNSMASGSAGSMLLFSSCLGSQDCLLVFEQDVACSKLA